jgi:hypothetical protein
MPTQGRPFVRVAAPRLSPPVAVALLGLLLIGPTLPPALSEASKPASLAEFAPQVRLAVGPEPAPGVPVTRPRRPPPPVVVRGSGFGHGVGLSQYGAQAQALAGRNYRHVLAHYYPGTALGRMTRNADIAVHLFSGRGPEPARLVLQTAGHDPRPPFRNVAVQTAPGASPVEIPHGAAWTLSTEGGEIIVRDGAGVVRARGRGPARITFAFTEHRPTLLRLPQLDRSYQWGWLRVSAHNGRLRPVLVVSVEHYLRGLAEMPPDWHAEALKAQVVAARTFALRLASRGLDPSCDCHLGTSQQDQVYAGWTPETGPHGGRWIRAVAATAGEILSAGDALAFTPYSSSHGGRTEASADSWAFQTSLPYLSSIEDAWSVDPAVRNPYARWEVGLPNAAVAEALGLREVRAIRVLRRTPGGSPAELEVTGVDRTGAPTVRGWDGPLTGVAAADLKLRFRAELPSQQFTSIGFGPFADDDGLPGEGAIVAVHEAGVMGGCERISRRFCPHGPVTRGEFANYLARGLGLSPTRRGATGAAAQLASQPASGTETPFIDVAGSVHEAAITALASRGAALGCAPDRFCPGEPLTVLDTAAMLARARTLSGIELERLLPVCDRTGRCPAQPLTREDAAVALARLFGL